MHTALRSLILHIICSNIVYAAATSNTPLSWKYVLKDKLVMPLMQAKQIQQNPHALLFHPETQELTTSRFKPYRDGQSTTVETYGDSALSKTTLFTQHFAATSLAAGDNNTIFLLGVTPKRVCLYHITESIPIVMYSKPVTKIRVKNKDNVIKLCAITPSAHLIALYAQHCKTGARYIGLCNRDSRSIKTFPLTSIESAQPITALAVSADGLSTAWVTNRRTVNIKRIDLYPSDHSFILDEAEIFTLSVSPDKLMLACGVRYANTSHATATHALVILSATYGTTIHRKITDNPVTACTFINENDLAFCTTGKLHIHRLHKWLPRIELLMTYLADLSPSADELMQKTAASQEPYKLQEHEVTAYKELAPLLQQPWLFTLPSAT